MIKCQAKYKIKSNLIFLLILYLILYSIPAFGSNDSSIAENNEIVLTDETTQKKIDIPVTKKNRSLKYIKNKQLKKALLYLLEKKYEKARKIFNAYLKKRKIRIDSDEDLISLIGLGISYENLKSNILAEGFYDLASTLILMRWDMIPRRECCTYFTKKIYGFNRLAPFKGLMRIALKKNDPWEALNQSEKIFFLKKLGSMACHKATVKNNNQLTRYNQYFIMRDKISVIYNEMANALDDGFRYNYFKYSRQEEKLMRGYNYYGLPLAMAMVDVSRQSIEQSEMLLECHFVGNSVILWLVYNNNCIVEKKVIDDSISQVYVKKKYEKNNMADHIINNPLNKEQLLLKTIEELIIEHVSKATISNIRLVIVCDSTAESKIFNISHDNDWRDKLNLQLNRHSKNRVSDIVRLDSLFCEKNDLLKLLNIE